MTLTKCACECFQFEIDRIAKNVKNVRQPENLRKMFYNSVCDSSTSNKGTNQSLSLESN